MVRKQLISERERERQLTILREKTISERNR